MTSRKNRFSLEACHQAAWEENHARHWSRVFYDKAREKGFRFAARAHRPGCIEGFDSDADLQAFDDKGELYKLPFVQRWEQDERFDHWELPKHSQDGEHLLVAHLKNGEHWVVAYFTPLSKIEGETP